MPVIKQYVTITSDSGAVTVTVKQGQVFDVKLTPCASYENELSNELKLLQHLMARPNEFMAFYDAIKKAIQETR